MQSKRIKGFTLVEMLLVLVIASTMIYMLIGYVQQRTQQTAIDKTALQMQQILTAAMSYYVVNGKWPGALGTNEGLPCLMGAAGCTTQYLVSGSATATVINTPYGTQYLSWVSPAPADKIFYVIAPVSMGKSSTSIANIIAAKLPLSYTASNLGPVKTPCDATSTTCFVYAAVNIPGQNLNNASAVNFAGLYHNGACVPQPKCPVAPDGTTMTPQIMVVPVSVSGVNDPGTTNPNLYPLESFTAYATGPKAATATTGPPACNTRDGSTTKCFLDKQGTGTVINDPGNQYWRVCLQVITEKGTVNWGSDADPSNWGQYAGLLAITRCAIKNEPAGSDFSVWAP